MEKRLVLFLFLSSAIFLGWSYFSDLLNPHPPQAGQKSPPLVGTPGPPSPALIPSPPAQQVSEKTVETPPAQEAKPWEAKVKTDHWVATISNRGGVITEWTMTSFPNGKPIDPPNGVTLISPKLSQEIGAPFRFYIPDDPALEKELNSANYQVNDGQEKEGNLEPGVINLKQGEIKEIAFAYKNNGIEAKKRLIFKGFGVENSTGFNFDFTAEVTRDNKPVQAFVVIGPNFGDQNVKHINIYRHAPQLTYASGSSINRETADSLKKNPISSTSSPVTWAAVDDNYFAMAIIPPSPQPAYRIVNNHVVSMAVLLPPQGEINHIYAGPKDLNILSQVTEIFGLAKDRKSVV